MPQQSQVAMGKKKPNTGAGAGDGRKIVTDARFAAVHSDPRFQRVPKHKAKVAIDSRFDQIFSDERFSSATAPVDKRGRPKKQNAQKNPLRHYYRKEEEEEVESSESEQLESDTDAAKTAEPSSESEDEAADVETDSTTDSDEEVEGDVYEEDEAEPLEEDIPCIEKETHRLAVVNMDWTHVKAVDLFVLLSSFLPKEGRILSVSVYPSEFGLQRMKEEVHGPVGLFDDEDGNDEDDENGEDEMDNEKLRAYERSKMRYYYGVVECDSIATADYLYKACDGAEFERSANVLDLRFIPDSMEFKHPPRDVATKAPETYVGLDFETRALQQTKMELTWDEDEPDRVKTLKRKLNDDQLADLELKEFLASEESESEEDDENENLDKDQCDKKDEKRQKYLALLQGDADSDGSDEDDEGKQDLEITFNTGLEDLSKRILEKKEQKSESVFESNLRKMREKKKKTKKNKSKDSSDDEEYSDTELDGTEEPGDFFVEERPAKRSKKDDRLKGKKGDKELQDKEEASKAELELLVADETGGDGGPKGYNIKRKKAKGKKGRESAEEDIAKLPTVDYSDPRFSAVFTSTLFALDPTDPQYKRSAAYLRQVALDGKKGVRREADSRESDKLPPDAETPTGGDLEVSKDERARSDLQPSRKEKYELSSLVKSLKMKSQQIQLPKERSKMRLAEEKHEPSSTQSLKKKKKNNNKVD